MKIASCGISNVGMKRTQNEDAYLINDEMGLYMVADGMGGHLGGEFASKLAVSIVEEVIHHLRFDPDATQIKGVNSDEANPGKQLVHAIQEAGKKIYDQATYDEGLRGMGTTAVAAMFCSPSLYIANVGDSRAYLIRKGKIQQMTEDHSLVSEQVKAGVISANDVRGHKLKNIITRSVGYQEQVDIDVKTWEVKPGDKIALCSDGLSNMVEDKEIRNIVEKYEPAEACQRLVDSANSHGGDDNITVVILQVSDIV